MGWVAISVIVSLPTAMVYISVVICARSIHRLSVICMAELMVSLMLDSMVNWESMLSIVVLWCEWMSINVTAM